MKNSIYMIALIFIGGSCSNLAIEEDGVYDVRAVEVLDSLSSTIGNLTAVSYTLNTVVKEKNQEGELVEFAAEHDVYMRGPDKLHFHSLGSRGELSFWYNGSNMSYYSYSKNEYGIIEAPETIVEAIDFIHNTYKIDFPAADFFYPTLTDDVLANNHKLLYWGESKVDDKTLHVLSAYNDNTTTQVWIDKSTQLPAKLVIFKEGDEKGERYEATFSNWRLNPALPDLLFEFKPSATAKNVPFQPKK